MTARHASPTDSVAGVPPQQPAGRDRRRSGRFLLICAIVGALLAGGAAYAASNWLVGLGGGSSGEAASGAVSNLTISAVASPAPGNLLYPGASGDVVVIIANPNPFPVTITAVNLPTNTTYATGYTTSALTSTQTGCLAATPSDVLWSFATGSSGSAHTLTTSSRRPCSEQTRSSGRAACPKTFALLPGQSSLSAFFPS